MDFLLEPLELGTEFEQLTQAVKITCEQGYSCDTGTVTPDESAGER